jgi:hypothetical protein
MGHIYRYTVGLWRVVGAKPSAKYINQQFVKGCATWFGLCYFWIKFERQHGNNEEKTGKDM